MTETEIDFDPTSDIRHLSSSSHIEDVCHPDGEV